MSLPSEFKWLDQNVVLAIHSEQIARHGGLSGIRELALLESALARPMNLFQYESALIAQCAAAYIFGIVRNHSFFDGNRRTGFVVGITFLLMNGYYISASEPAVVITITSLAAGQMSEEELVDWMQRNLTKL